MQIFRALPDPDPQPWQELKIKQLSISTPQHLIVSLLISYLNEKFISPGVERFERVWSRHIVGENTAVSSSATQDTTIISVSNYQLKLCLEFQHPPKTNYLFILLLLLYKIYYSYTLFAFTFPISCISTFSFYGMFHSDPFFLLASFFFHIFHQSTNSSKMFLLNGKAPADIPPSPVPLY